MINKKIEIKKYIKSGIGITIYQFIYTCKLAIRIPDWSGIQMVQTKMFHELSDFHMVS